jgi:phospholipase D1/2
LSFAPRRRNIKAKWLINGKEYFDQFITLMERAKHRIFIAGWYLAPGLYLKRDPVVEKYRLDRLLLRKAEQGVKIYVLLWAASQFAFNLQSGFVTEYLNALHKNIQCMSHPQFTPLTWTHHQKFGK